MYSNQGLPSYHSALNHLSDASSPNLLFGYEARVRENGLVLSNCLITGAFDKELVCFPCFEGDVPGDTQSVCDALEDEVLRLLAK